MRISRIARAGLFLRREPGGERRTEEVNATTFQLARRPTRGKCPVGSRETTSPLLKGFDVRSDMLYLFGKIFRRQLRCLGKQRETPPLRRKRQEEFRGNAMADRVVENTPEEEMSDEPADEPEPEIAM